MPSKFTAPQPDSMIIGRSMIGMIKALGDEVRPLIEKHGLTDVQPESWYPLQAYYDLLADVMDGAANVSSDLVNLGMRSAMESDLPPGVERLEDVLMSFEATYQLFHRNAGTAWTIERPDPNTFIMTDASGYPPDLTYGVIYGFVQRMGDGRDFTVSYQNLAQRGLTKSEPVTFVVELD